MTEETTSHLDKQPASSFLSRLKIPTLRVGCYGADANSEKTANAKDIDMNVLKAQTPRTQSESADYQTMLC